MFDEEVDVAQGSFLGFVPLAHHILKGRFAKRAGFAPHVLQGMGGGQVKVGSHCRLGLLQGKPGAIPAGHREDCCERGNLDKGRRGGVGHERAAGGQVDDHADFSGL